MLFTILCILNYVAFVSKMEYLCKLFMAPLYIAFFSIIQNMAFISKKEC